MQQWHSKSKGDYGGAMGSLGHVREEERWNEQILSKQYLILKGFYFIFHHNEQESGEEGQYQRWKCQNAQHDTNAWFNLH